MGGQEGKEWKSVKKIYKCYIYVSIFKKNEKESKHYVLHKVNSKNEFHKLILSPSHNSLIKAI